MYNSILVPVDFSEESITAVKNSIGFLKEGGKITVLHVFPVELASYLAFFQDMSFFADASRIEAGLIKLREEAEEKLAEIVSEYSEKGINIDAEIIDGKPYVEIIKKSKDYDLVSLGLRVKDYGVSVSPMKVIRKAESDVLVMKGTSTLSPEKVLFPIDINYISPRIVEMAKTFKEKYGSKLYFLSVIELLPFEDIEYLGGQDVLNLEAMKQKVISVLEENMGIEDAEYIVVSGVDVADEIKDFAEKSGIDLVVMAHKKMSGFERTILGSTSEKFVNVSALPTLIIK